MNNITFENLSIPTMGTGRWYAVLNSSGEEIDRIFIDEDSVCHELYKRHEYDANYEGAWDASNDEYEEVYSELCAATIFM